MGWGGGRCHIELFRAALQTNGSPPRPPHSPVAPCRDALNEKEQRIAAALAQIDHHNTSLRAAAANWGIPISTLQERSKHKRDIATVMGRPPSLPAEVESKLAHYAGVLSLQGFSMDRRQVAQLAKEVAVKLKVPIR